VEELLVAGIAVVGSVNLQYIDDQREAVERITGKKVTQTIPRAFLNTADEIVIVDTPPSHGSPALSTLREKALLLSADVIDAGLRRYLHDHGIEASWRTHEHFLIYLTPGADVERMLASARRNAARFHCDVLAASVNNAGRPEADRKSLGDALAEARASGVRVEMLDGDDPVETVVQYARAHGVTQIFVGRDRPRGFRDRWSENPIDRLIREAGGMDVRVFPPTRERIRHA
jgi:two-component system sensor histidine kinase KdpD